MICIRYRIEFAPAAEQFLDGLRDRRLLARLHQAIERLRDNPHPSGCKKMQGLPGYRIRVGDYRIVYRVQGHSLLITVIKIGHRKEIYR